MLRITIIILWLFKIPYSDWLTSGKTMHMPIVVRIFRICTGVPDVVYLAGSLIL
jgi:hypothetical protein